jgi:aspartyl-tRNA(Asn)/glutamyl-tRNA(Gln) amidotransferase subunit B
MSATATPDADPLTRYEAVIGIEIHCQLRTASKMFCACSTAYDGAAPNTHVCPVCLGLPGALPVINRRAVEHVLATGLAVDATTPEATRWDRKNYFYPDLPKGYQISQYDLPLASAGRLTVDTSTGPITVGITRAHLEEDTAKLVHATADDGRKVSLVDFNRSGAPLMEIVTDPDIRTAEAARRYAEELQLVLRTIGASDADMERGQMRVEANVSLRPRGSEAFGTRVEVKNMNSFRSLERAIEFEIGRQAAALDAGEALHQETRGWSDDRGVTYRMRSKETSDDYRYFPEPDLPPLHVEPDWLAAIAAGMPELPAARRRRLEDAGLKPATAATLVASKDLWTAFELTREVAPDLPADALGNVVTQEYAYGSNTNSHRGPKGFVGHSSPNDLATIVRLLTSGEISRTNAKEVLEENIATGQSAALIVERRGFRQISDLDSVASAVDDVLAANADAVADYRAGKTQAIGFLVGQVMKATRGQANASLVQSIVRERLERSAR